MSFLPGTTIEIIGKSIAFRPRGRVRSALFDFDGTISLIREGWQQVMIPMMVELLAQTPEHESEPELHAIVVDYVDRLTGKQTIYQMIQLCEELKKRGAEPLEPLAYKQMYHHRLWERIEGRVAGLKAGRIPPGDLMVPGATDLLANLRESGVVLYLASGTDLAYVQDEAAALGVADYFDGGIYGALDRWENFSKAMVIEQILREHRLQGEELVAFGDGYVEIENAKRVGGIAVGVASDEVRRAGINEWKRNRLIQAGADLIVPEFREHARLLEYLLDGE
ncbi:MAG: HAD family hydrolase [Chloroflexi bacterium]|nr:HAD family hydrolase [Chloroflexota bacterium]